MRFLKEHFDSVVRLIVFQIGIAIFSFFLYTAAGAISTDNTSSLTMKICISVFSIIFYLTLIHTMMWEEGAKDKIRVDAGRAEKQSFKGLGIAFYANVINFVITGIAVIFMAVYMLGGPDGFKTAFGVLNLVFRMTLSMYLGIIQAAFYAFSAGEDLYFFLQSIGFFVIPVITIISAHVSYTLGHNEKRLFGFLGNGTKSNKK